MRRAACSVVERRETRALTPRPCQRGYRCMRTRRRAGRHIQEPRNVCKYRCELTTVTTFNIVLDVDVLTAKECIVI
jgi:hypothetical protein